MRKRYASNDAGLPAMGDAMAADSAACPHDAQTRE